MYYSIIIVRQHIRDTHYSLLQHPSYFRVYVSIYIVRQNRSNVEKEFTKEETSLRNLA